MPRWDVTVCFEGPSTSTDNAVVRYSGTCGSTGQNSGLIVNDCSSATFSSGGLNLACGDAYSVDGSSVLTETTLGSSVVNSSITNVGALACGSIATGFGAIDNGTSNITSGGVWSVDVDSGATINSSGGGIGLAGSLTLGAGADAGLYVKCDDLYIENKTTDKDIVFRISDGGTFTEVARVVSSVAGFRFAEIATPAQPSGGDGGYLYAKADGKPYWRSNEIGETDLSGGGVALGDSPAWTGKHQFQLGAVCTGGSSYYKTHIANNNAVTANTGTTGMITAFAVCEPNVVVSGGASATTTATVLINGAATEGTNNYALLVDSGNARFDGTVRVSDGSVSLPSLTWESDPDNGFFLPCDNNFRAVTNGIAMFNVHEGSGGFNIEFGDTSNGDGDRQLTLNQGDKNNVIFALKSSDVEHTFVAKAELDTFGQFAKMCGNTGGLRIESYNGTSSPTFSMMLKGYAYDACTDKNAGGNSPVDIRSAVRCGTGATSYTNMNMFTVSREDNGNVLFLVDLEGDYFYYGSPGTFDEYCDVGLVRAFTTSMAQANCSKGIIHSKWDDYVQANEEQLVQLGVLGDYVNCVPPCKVGLVNGPQLQRLHNGAIWQLHTALMDTKDEVRELSNQLRALQEGE